MITRAEQIRDLASECRSISKVTKDAYAREQLLDVAVSLERVAQHHAAQRPPPLKSAR